MGVFDGVHIGHQKLIQKTVARAKKIQGQSVIVTFAPHPVQVLQPQKYLPYIIPLTYRLELFRQLGVDGCVVIHFTKRFAGLRAEDFVKRYLVDTLSVQDIFVGNEFRFGQGREGSIDFLKAAGQKYQFQATGIFPLKRQQLKIGSSGIRTLIAEGQLAKARRYLGRYVSLTGKVQRGDGRGKRLGFATANVIIQDEVMPPFGVYAVYVHIKNQRYSGMANIGTRPSFKKKAKANVEVHIFDFAKTIYDQEIRIEFVKKIRNEKVFPSKTVFIQQLKQDEVKARRLLV